MFTIQAVNQPTNPAYAFGAWLRELRMERGLAIREVAAATAMDQALLGNIEHGRRWPSKANTSALIRFLAVDRNEFHRRLETARFWHKHGDNPAFVTAIAAQVQEDAATYGVVDKKE